MIGLAQGTSFNTWNNYKFDIANFTNKREFYRCKQTNSRNFTYIAIGV